MKAPRLHHIPLLSVAALGLYACAQLPPAVAELPWHDLYGDRGRQVLARDYAMCESLVEQHRSLMEGCMASRGWDTRPQ